MHDSIPVFTSPEGQSEAMFAYQAVMQKGDLIPDAEIEMIPNAHYVAALAQPELVNQRLLQFFTPEQDEQQNNENLAVMEVM